MGLSLPRHSDEGPPAWMQVIEPRLEQAAEVVERRREQAAELGISTIDAEKDSTTIILEELPGIDNAGFEAALKSNHPGEAAGYYINGLLTFGIGLATVLAVLMITIGGFQYITTDSFMQKSEGKKRIQDSLMGLGLILVSYLLLGTINSDLLKIRFGLSPIKLEGTSFSLKSNIEYITTAAIEANNQNLINMCEGGSNEPEDFSLPTNKVLKKIDAHVDGQIKELEGYKTEVKKEARSSNGKTYVVTDILSESPSGIVSKMLGRNYADYGPKEYHQSCDNFEKKSNKEKCLSIENYIGSIDKMITQINKLRNRCKKSL